jgi:hypothetical protein
MHVLVMLFIHHNLIKVTPEKCGVVVIENTKNIYSEMNVYIYTI